MFHILYSNNMKLQVILCVGEKLGIWGDLLEGLRGGDFVREALPLRM